MDVKHKNRINSIIDELSTTFNFDVISQQLKNKGIFSADHIWRFNKENTNRDKNYHLLKNLCTRGPRAYNALIRSFVETNHFKSVDILDPKL